MSRLTREFVSSSPHTGLSPSVVRLSRLFRSEKTNYWPGPRSLATTSGVSVDFLSSGYLDVSVPRVRSNSLCIQLKVHLTVWVAPFGHIGINAYSRLPRSFRSVSRPSSPLSAKASTKCSCHCLILIRRLISPELAA